MAEQPLYSLVWHIALLALGYVLAFKGFVQQSDQHQRKPPT
jgi:hypothetical protein